jgi:hypothetical protein
VPGLKSRVRTARLLSGGILPTEITETGLILRLPSRAPDPVASVIAVELERPVDK